MKSFIQLVIYPCQISVDFTVQQTKCKKKNAGRKGRRVSHRHKGVASEKRREIESYCNCLSVDGGRRMRKDRSIKHAGDLEKRKRNREKERE